MYNHNDQFYDSLSIYTAILQLLTIQIASQDATNNDLMMELKKQDNEYFEKIIKQNEEIIRLLTSK